MIERKNVIPMFQVTDMMDVIKEERCRLEKNVHSEEFAKRPMWGWMMDWLEKSNEDLLQEAMEIIKEEDVQQDLGNYVCHICFKPNRYFLITSFPTGDGFGHSIKICDCCGKKIGELAEQLNQLKEK